MRSYITIFISIIALNLMSFNYCMAQTVVINSANISANSGAISANSGNISDNSSNISDLQSNLNSEVAATNSDFVSLRLHSDEQDVVMLDKAKKFSSGLTAMSIATANSINSTGGDVELGLGIGFGSVNGEDAFAIGLVAQDADNKVRMSLNVGFNEHVNATIGAGLFFKLR